MIIDMNNPKDQQKINQLQKASGVKLIQKYLPHLCVQKQVFSVNTIEEWRQIKDKLPQTVTIRTDNRIGNPIPEMAGITCEKEKVEEYMKEALGKEKEPYFLCMELEENTGERINTKGGFLIDATMGGTVKIEHTGPMFDCRELTKGKAAHETWEIPWEDVLFMKGSNHRKWHLKTISQEAYRDTAVERMIYLIGKYKERKQEIMEKMPAKYKEIDPRIMEKLINEVIIPMWLRKEELLKDGLEKFDVELNILANNRFVPFEICRPERFIYQAKKKEEREIETR
jgi:hypothetical protein